MGSTHQLWVLRNVSWEVPTNYGYLETCHWSFWGVTACQNVSILTIWCEFRKNMSKHNWSSQGILGWDWGGTLKGYGLIAWCDEPYAILYYYFFCHHWQVLLSTLQLASLRGSKFMNLIRATLRALVHIMSNIYIYIYNYCTLLFEIMTPIDDWFS